MTMFIKSTIFPLFAAVTLTQALPLPELISWLGSVSIPSSTATSFAVTCSGSSGPSCNVFVPVESGFQMYTGSPSASGPWSSLQTPLQFGNGQSPALNTPMAAVNTFDQGGDEIAMFWPQNGALMVMNATSMTSDSFQTYTVASSISTPVHMVATAWRNTGGNPAYSVLFNDDNGVVYQWRRDALGNWNDDGILNGITVNGAFTASVSVNSMNAHTVDIFTDAGRKIETTSGPTLSGCEVVSQATNTLPGISGGYLPWSDHSEVRLYAIEGGDLTVTMNPPHFGTWSSSPFGGVQPVDPSTVTVATAAAFYTAWGVTHFISVFSLVPNGNQHSIQMISKVPGNPWDSGINLTGPI